jgi:hypothetical protein
MYTLDHSPMDSNPDAVVIGECGDSGSNQNDDHAGGPLAEAIPATICENAASGSNAMPSAWPDIRTPVDDTSDAPPDTPQEEPENRQADAAPSGSPNGRSKLPLAALIDRDSGKPPAAEVPITDFTIEFTLMHLLRCEEVFRAARGVFEPEHLSTAGETPHREIWRATLDYHENYGRLPSHSAISAMVLSRVETGLLK